MDEVVHEGVIAGIPAISIWDWTLAEIIEAVTAYHERERRHGQQLAQLAHGLATDITCRFSDRGQMPDLWELYPFWTDEEVKEAKLQKYKYRMMKLTAGGGKHG